MLVVYIHLSFQYSSFILLVFKILTLIIMKELFSYALHILTFEKYLSHKWQ